MSDRIEEGDIVNVYWDDSEGTSLPNAVVLHTPSDTGDMWSFKDERGAIHYVNPCCHTLNSIVKPAPK